MVLTDAGKQVTDDLWVVLGDMRAEELELLVVRSANTALTADTTKFAVIIGTIISFLVLSAIAWFLSRSISNGVGAVGRGLQQIAAGRLTARVDIKSSDEIGAMAESYRQMQEYLQEASQVANQIGGGDLTVAIRPRSEDDSLNTAFAQMTGNLKTLVGQVRDSSARIVKSSEELTGAADRAGRSTQSVNAISTQIATGA